MDGDSSKVCSSCGAKLPKDAEKCQKCGYRIKRGILPLEEIVFKELNGFKGVSIENQFFLITNRNKNKWRFKLLDTMLKRELTGWIICKNPEALRTCRDALALRHILKEQYTNGLQVLEHVVITLEQHIEDFTVEESAPKQISEEQSFNEDELASARKLLMDPAFFYKLGKVFEWGFVVPKINKARFVLGEERNKRLLGLLLIGGAKLGMTTITKVLGDPGTAKDTMVRMWLKLLQFALNYVERSYITAATLRYSTNIEAADLLYVPDSPELRGEIGRHLRFMRADDGGLISEYAMRDPETGEMTTKVVEVPVKAIITTSNAITVDPALESGTWTLTTDASSELTSCVKLEKLKLRAGQRPLFPEDELRIWQAAFHLLLNEDLPEQIPMIPFATKLMRLLDSDRSESRRNPDKLCDLISLIAWVRRFQKPVEKRHEADFIDLYIALRLGWDAITQTMSELNPKEYTVYSAIKTAPHDIDVTCRYIANESGLPYKTAYRYLEKLIEKGYVLKDRKGGRNVYSISSTKTPKEFLILERRNLGSPKELIDFVLDVVEDFSSSYSDMNTITFVDPITGDVITCSKNNGTITTEVERKLYLWPYTAPEHTDGPCEKVRSHVQSCETSSNNEKVTGKLLPSGIRNSSETDFIFHRIKPAEKCEYCGKFPVEYEINDIRGHQILRRCSACFQKMRRMFAGSVWKEVQ